MAEKRPFTTYNKRYELKEFAYHRYSTFCAPRSLFCTSIVFTPGVDFYAAAVHYTVAVYYTLAILCTLYTVVVMTTTVVCSQVVVHCLAIDLLPSSLLLIQCVFC